MTQADPIVTDAMLQELEPAKRLFMHTRRPEWGVGLWVTSDRSSRTMQFEDGKQRTFREGYYHLLSPVDPNVVDVENVFVKMVGEAQLTERDALRAETRPVKEPVMDFDRQIEVFLAQYPGGFEDEEYLHDYRRASEEKGGRKSHFEQAMLLAQDELEKEKLERKLVAGDLEGIFNDMVNVLRRTSLVSPSKEVAPIEEIESPEARAKIAAAMVEMLHSEEGHYRYRFAEFLNALRQDGGVNPSWGLATALPSLVHPDKHVCVKRQVFDLQARSIKPEAIINKDPDHRSYGKALTICRLARKRLEDAGHPPADYHDVRTFIWLTLRPRGQNLGKSLPKG